MNIEVHNQDKQANRSFSACKSMCVCVCIVVMTKQAVLECLCGMLIRLHARIRRIPQPLTVLKPPLKYVCVCVSEATGLAPQKPNRCGTLMFDGGEGQRLAGCRGNASRTQTNCYFLFLDFERASKV